MIEKFADIFDSLKLSRSHHNPAAAEYRRLRAETDAYVSKSAFSRAGDERVAFGPFGDIILPFRRMGAIDSTHLFGIDELIIFTFYDLNRDRYKKCLDVGANLGLHSIVMASCGFEVKAFEPDPVHYRLLKKNLALNNCQTVTALEAAVSDRSGTAEFVRVLGNTTGSHLTGAKDTPYGAVERFSVNLENIAEHTADADFIKIDAEGHEAKILMGIPHADLLRCEIMLEVGSVANAHCIYESFRDLPIGLYAQKIGWEKVKHVEDMPTSYRDGSLFASARPMNWQVSG